jgi:hypothetical protein
MENLPGRNEIQSLVFPADAGYALFPGIMPDSGVILVLHKSALATLIAGKPYTLANPLCFFLETATYK